MAKRPSFDKEAMFQKIMPDLSGPVYVPAAEEEPAPQPLPEAPPAGSSAQPPAIRGGLRAGGVLIRETKEQVLVNIMELAVAAKLDAAFSRFNCCRCDKCRKDVAAIALNKLTPKYVVVEQGKEEAYVSLVNSSEVTTAIVQAIIQVKAHPRH